ncbi:MAG TPA: ATP-binding protein [Gaiellaceae bacterium]|nr:ATP-binding protein [Gaiellaceae bacterium]
MTNRLLLGYVAVTVLVLAILEIPLGITYARNERQDLTTKVERDAVAMASLAEDALEGRAPRDVRPLARLAGDYAAETGGRIVVAGRRGRSVVDTSPTFRAGRDFSTRPEFAQALAGEVATGVRNSETLGTNLLYVAVPVASRGEIHGAVRITYPTSALDARIRRYWLVLAAIGAVLLAAAAVIGLAIARSVTGPIRDVERAAEALGRGDLSARAPAEGPEEVRDLAHVFNETAARLQALLHSQEAFVADASHQLRTPLTALRLRLENLEADVPPAGRASLEGAVAEVERLSGLVEGLLALARSDASDETAERLNLAALVEGRAEAWSALADERAVMLETSQDGPAFVRAAPGRVEQVLDNLLANALEVSPEGGKIRVGTSRGRDWVELHVVDEGPGLDEEERERAFDRFWRGRRSGEGSGLGLAIVKRLVAADDGQVELRAASQQGIDAVVRLRPS